MVENTVGAIMVTYNPDADLKENIESIIASAAKLVIIDNGSNEQTTSYIKSIETHPAVTVIYNGQNLGLGKALNQGIEYYIQDESITWIATFDQDSKISDHFFTGMLTTYEALPNKKEVAILAPNWVDEKLLHEQASESPNTTALVEEMKTVITSGSLMKKSVFKHIGLFLEEYFIDFLDIEICLRARANGYKIYMVPTVSMVHNLGNTERHQLLGSRVMATNHNHIRRYYITRNRLLTYKKYHKVEREWLREDFISTLKEFVIVLLFEKDRVRKINSMMKGSLHGLFGRTGPM